MKRDIALAITKVTRHQYYHKAKGTKKTGRPPTKVTAKGSEIIPNEKVVEQIKTVQEDPDTNYGYRNMSFQLMLLGYFINHKKVYRLMRGAGLLKDKIKQRNSKEYVKYRIVTPSRPLEVLEMDIKMVWVTEHRRHAYILTIIDTFTIYALHWSVGYQMKEFQVREAWDQVIIRYLQPHDLLSEKLHVELRNDNGPQFSSVKLQEYLKENHIKQVFTHPYTPQENGHVESFHNILKNALGKNPFWSLEELENRLTIFYKKYNNIRLHGSTAHLPPKIFWLCWEAKLIDVKILAKKRISFKLNVSYQELSNNRSLREALCSNYSTLEGENNLMDWIKEVNGANTSNEQPSVQQSPSVALCS